MAVGAGLCAATSVAGTIAGPKVNQAIRNATADLQKAISPAANKISGFALDKLGTTNGLVSIGALTGVIGGIPLAIAAGAIAGPIGAAVTLVGSAIISGVKFAKMAKDIAQVKDIEKMMPGLEEINNAMCHFAINASPELQEALKGMTEEQQQAFYKDLQAQSLEELKGKEKEINAIKKGLSNAIYAQLKEPMKKIKGKEEKSEFLASQIEALKPEIFQATTQNIISLMQQEEAGTAS